MSAPTVLDVRGLVRHFGAATAVDGVSFSVEAGQTYGLLGPNGAGKTTTISMICGLLEPDSGAVEVAGSPVSTTSTAGKSAVGLVPQDIALYPDLSLRANLRFFGSLQGLSGRALAGRAADVLAVVGLSERARDRVDTYSGGMKRRANIAVGLLHRPQLLVLDEPTVGVDPQSRYAIMDSLAELGGQDLAVLYTTHYLEEAERLCDRIGILDEGRLIAEGTREELLALVGGDTAIRLSAAPRTAAGTGGAVSPVDSAVELRPADGGAETAATASTDVGDAAASSATPPPQALLAWQERCRLLPGVREVDVTGGDLLLVSEDRSRPLGPAVAVADELGLTITAAAVSEPDLEQVFLHLTGKALRD